MASTIPTSTKSSSFSKDLDGETDATTIYDLIVVLNPKDAILHGGIFELFYGHKAIINEVKPGFEDFEYRLLINHHPELLEEFEDLMRFIATLKPTYLGVYTLDGPHWEFPPHAVSRK